MAKPGPKKRTVSVDSPLVSMLRDRIRSCDVDVIAIDAAKKYIADAEAIAHELDRMDALARVLSGSTVSVQALADLCEITYAAIQRYLRMHGHVGTGRVPNSIAVGALSHYRNK